PNRYPHRRPAHRLFRLETRPSRRRRAPRLLWRPRRAPPAPDAFGRHSSRQAVIACGGGQSGPPSAPRRSAHAPDRVVAVLGEQLRAVLCRGDADRPAPYRRIVNDEAGDEVLVFAGRHAVVHDRADDLVAGAGRAIPGAVLGGKDAAAVFGREPVAGIDRELQRGRMRLEQDVGNDDLVLEVGPLALVARVFVRADVIPGPAVEAAFAHARDVVGRQIVAEPVALVGRAPQVAGGRMHREAGAVADASGENLLVLALGIED